jgi:hypothetical protein
MAPSKPTYSAFAVSFHLEHSAMSISFLALEITNHLCCGKELEKPTAVTPSPGSLTLLIQILERPFSLRRLTLSTY